MTVRLSRAISRTFGVNGCVEETVRILFKYPVMRLNNCGGEEKGRCKLGACVESESLSFDRAGRQWDKCSYLHLGSLIIV